MADLAHERERLLATGGGAHLERRIHNVHQDCREKENDLLRATKLLETVVSSDDSTIIEKARALLGLQRSDEAINLLEDEVRNNPLDLLAWHILIMAKRKDGEVAVRGIVKSMLEAGNVLSDPTTPNDSFQSLKLDDAAKEYASHVMNGIIAGNVKHMLMGHQITSYLVKESGGEL